MDRRLVMLALAACTPLPAAPAKPVPQPPAQLANHKTTGTAAIEHGHASVTTGGYLTSESIEANDPLAPKDGAIIEIRVADEYAAKLIEGRDPPPAKFHRYWPVAERDRAIAKLVAWLEAK